MNPHLIVFKVDGIHNRDFAGRLPSRHQEKGNPLSIGFDKYTIIVFFVVNNMSYFVAHEEPAHSRLRLLCMYKWPQQYFLYYMLELIIHCYSKPI